ncbi:hypothetical protein AGMMS49574_10890 [Bacteroidia bacterium]|nr:hypothetical protein AGMMS49574_10890 [Bacteroidia bacterium]
MIKIEINDIEGIAKNFVERIEKSILKNKFQPQQKKFPDDELHKLIHEIYLCKAEELENKHTEFKNYLQQNSINENDIEKKYFDYKTIIEYKKDKISHAYWLMNVLKINTCPYCNRQYTFTINNKGIRPQIDHYYSQSQNPYLALSFYNLIPSCPNCNQIKSNKSIDINPHIADFGANYRFVINNKNIGNPTIIDKKDIEVDFSNNNKNITVFGLKELYNKHKDYVEEIIDKAQAYNSTYYDSLIQSFSGLGATPEQIDRYVWGNYTEMADQCKRPLSKLTRDVLEQLDIK